MPRALDEATMETCFGAAPDAISIFDRDGRCLFANRAALVLLGRGEARGRTLRELDVPTRVRDAIDGACAAVLADGDARTIETDGRALALRAQHRVSAMRDGEGCVLGAVVVTREVELGALHADARFRSIANRAPMMLWVSSPENRIVWYNDPWLAFRGRTLEDETGTCWLEAVHAEDREHARAISAAAFAAKEPFELEMRLRRADGEYRWVHDSAVPDHGPDGAFRGYVGTRLDVTERKRLEEARQRRIDGAEAERAAAELERARFHRLLLHAPALVAIMRGPDHVYEFANERFCRTVPEARRLIGTSARKHRADLVEQQFLDLLDHVYETGEPYETAEVPLVVAQDDGSSDTVYLSFIYQPIRRGDGAIEGIASFAFDVTESVLARKQVEEASRAKDEFLSTLSHELRTPLNAIVGWSHLLRTNALDAGQSQRALEAIDRNARVQKRLIDDLLDFARMVSGKLGLHVAPIDLVSVVTTAVDSIRPSVGAKNVSLVLDVESPTGGRGPTIVGDPDRLQQVVWNLLSNALKFTGPRGRVSIEVAARETVAELVVTDDGVGIDAPFLGSVFERFRQADSSTTRRHGGLGLGLAIARSIVELHGGTIVAESEGLGRGTTVRVRLPLRDEERAAVVERRVAPAPATSRLRGVRVLVVDDEEDARALADTALHRSGASVCVVASASEALDALHEGEFDVMVSDIGMPELDGITLIQRIRGLPPPVSRIPAIAVTAYARTEDRDRAVGAGYDAFLTKPIEVDELGALVAHLTGRA